MSLTVIAHWKLELLTRLRLNRRVPKAKAGNSTFTEKFETHGKNDQ